MPVKVYLFVFLLLQTYLQVAHFDMIHNENSSGSHNASLNEDRTAADTIDGDIRLNITQANEKKYNDSGFVKHVTKKKNRRHKTRKTNKFQKNTGIINLERSSDMILTEKTAIDNEHLCEAMVLTYGPIGFSSALELIGNASNNHNHSLHTQNDSGVTIGGNNGGKFNKRIIIEDQTAISSSLDESKMSEEGIRKRDGNAQLKLILDLHHQNIHDKRGAESVVHDSTHVIGIGCTFHGASDVANSNEGITDESEDREGDSLEKEKLDGSDKTQDGNNYSVSHVLKHNTLRGREGGKEQILNSIPIELRTSEKKRKYSKTLNSKEYLNKSTILDSSENVDKNGKPCPKQPKFIDKITIDKGNYNNNQNVAVKRRGIDTKQAQEHFRAKTNLVEEQISSYGDKSEHKEDAEKKIVSKENSDEDNRKNIFEDETITQKIIRKRYIPQLHPMPETDEEKKNKDAAFVAYYLNLSGGSSRFEGKTTDEIKKELAGYFSTWPKPRDWLYSDRNEKTSEQNKSTIQEVPIHIYQSPTDVNMRLQTTYNRNTLYSDRNEKRYAQNEPTIQELPIHIYDKRPENEFNRNMQDPHPKTDETFVYPGDNIPLEVPYEPPRQYTLYHKERDNNNYNPCNPERKDQTMNIDSTVEADYYPIDFQSIFKKYDHENSYMTENNEPMLQEHMPEYRYQEERPIDTPVLETNQQQGHSDYLADPESIISFLDKIRDDKDNSKPNIKIFRVRFKPTDSNLEDNTSQNKKPAINKRRITSQGHKKKTHRKCNA